MILTILPYLLLPPAAFAAYVLILIARLRLMEGPRSPIRNPPAPRPGIWLMSHRADERRAYPFQHMFYRITPRDPQWVRREGALFVNRDADGQAFCTIGAGPVDGLLTVGFNRVWDLEIPISFEAPAGDCTVEEENRRIEALIAGARAYDNSVRFSSWPPVNGPGHNCNGLMAALAMRAGVELPGFTGPFMLTTGSERPVPGIFFRN